MDKLQSFPFEIGQEAESKSHVGGYRGAWFRCKIKDINLRKGEVWCALEYFDFPDEKVSWTKVYQKDPTDKSWQQQKKKMQLMMRPHFPHFYRECDLPDSQIISGTVAIINNEWQVGNMVDLWSDGCFWSGRIVAILDNDKVEVELPKPPVGEGGSYSVNCNNLRPTLFWSIEDGWMVPLCESGGNFRACVRLGLPLKKELVPNVQTNIQAMDKNSSWRNMVLQYSNCDAEMFTEWKQKQQEESKGLSTSPDFQEQYMDIITGKYMAGGMDHPSITFANLGEFVRGLSETDGGRQLVHEAGANLKVGRAECHSSGILNCEALAKSASCHNCQEVMLPMDETNVVPSSNQCHDLGVSHQELHRVRSDTNTAITMQCALSSGVESSAVGINVFRNDSCQSLTNDAASATRGNAFVISRHKKELVRMIIERAKFLHHGRGRHLKRKFPHMENNFSFSAGSQIDMPSNKQGKSHTKMNSNIDGTMLTALRHSLLKVHRDVCPGDFNDKGKLEESQVRETNLARHRTHSTGQIPSCLKRISATGGTVKFGVSQTGSQWDGWMEGTIPKQVVDSKGGKEKTDSWCRDGDDIYRETSICNNDYSDAHIKSNNLVKCRVISTRMGREEHGSTSSCIDVDTIESSVMTLEELVNKVRWLRGVMQFGFKQWSTMTKTTWQFVEKPRSCKEAGRI